MNLFHPFVQQGFECIEIRPFLSRNKDTIILHLVHPSSFQFVQVDILACTRSQVIFILRDESEGINLVEHHNHRFLRLVDFRQGAVHHLDLFFECRMGDIDNMHQQVRLTHLIQG